MGALTEEQWDAIRVYHRALGAFVAHFDERWLPPILNEKRWAVIDAGDALLKTLDADQQ